MTIAQLWRGQCLKLRLINRDHSMAERIHSTGDSRLLSGLSPCRENGDSDEGPDRCGSCLATREVHGLPPAGSSYPHSTLSRPAVPRTARDPGRRGCCWCWSRWFLVG